jgi:hypothetical protein
MICNAGAIQMPSGKSSTSVLAHHACVFMFEDMAMIHEGVLARRRPREIDQ